MGVIYSVIPLASDIAEWLDEQHVAYPHGAAGRNPTPDEVRDATSNLHGFVVEYIGGDQFTQVDIHAPNEAEGPWTLLNLQSRRGSDVPVEIYFEKGWPEAIVPVLLRLSAVTGPLLLLADTGEAPVVITPDKALETVLEEWEHTSSNCDDSEDKCL
jgi:hypothetical protein